MYLWINISFSRFTVRVCDICFIATPDIFQYSLFISVLFSSFFFHFSLFIFYLLLCFLITSSIFFFYCVFVSFPPPFFSFNTFILPLPFVHFFFPSCVLSYFSLSFLSFPPFFCSCIPTQYNFVFYLLYLNFLSLLFSFTLQLFIFSTFSLFLCQRQVYWVRSRHTYLGYILQVDYEEN